MILCTHCRSFMSLKATGVFVLIQYVRGDCLTRVELFKGDQYECPQCGAGTVSNFAAEAYETNPLQVAQVILHLHEGGHPVFEGVREAR